MQNYQCNIAVVAAGPSGLAAAVTAAENGMDEVILEKSSVTGGAANMGMGPFGVESRIQKANMIAIRKEDVFREMMEYTHWQTDARKLREYIWKSGSTIDWLEDMGVEFAGPCKYFPSAYPTWHAVKPEGGGAPGPRCAGTMNKVLTNRATQLGAKLLLNTKAVSLIKEDGRIRGVRALDTQTGEEVEVRSDAVIVATGGFGDNPEMIDRYAGCTYGKDMFNIRIPGKISVSHLFAFGKQGRDRTGDQPVQDSGQQKTRHEDQYKDQADDQKISPASGTQFRPGRQHRYRPRVRRKGRADGVVRKCGRRKKSRPDSNTLRHSLW